MAAGVASGDDSAVVLAAPCDTPGNLDLLLNGVADALLPVQDTGDRGGIHDAASPMWNDDVRLCLPWLRLDFLSSVWSGTSPLAFPPADVRLGGTPGVPGTLLGG